MILKQLDPSNSPVYSWNAPRIQLGKTLVLAFSVLSIDTVINFNKNTSLENNGTNFLKAFASPVREGR